MATDEALSLATFEPDRCFAPYLNTPRSLEACRMNGINPLELVEIPISEFQKEFPNDPDAAQRRYDRIDGARRRILLQVKRDWKTLVKDNWKPPAPANSSPAKREAILHVPPEAHSTVLENQAAMFRKVEEEEWAALQRNLRMQLRKADEEVRHKEILAKHDEIAEANDNQRLERQRLREQLHKEQLERNARKEQERMKELKLLQAKDAEYAREKARQEVERKKMEKAHRERCEAERVQRLQYTIQMKNSIVQGIENKIDSRKQVLEMREKNLMQRQEEARRERMQENERRRQQMEAKLQRAKDEADRRDREEREAVCCF